MSVAGVARVRNVGVPPRKVNRAADLIRGQAVGRAEAILKYASQKTDYLGKGLQSAAANAVYLAEKDGTYCDREALVITEVRVNEGPTMKRIRPRAQGRAYRIRKRSSHIEIVVAMPIDEEK